MTDLSDKLYHEQYDKKAMLSNGGSVELKVAAKLWDQLQSLAMRPQMKKDLLELRDHALAGSAFQGELREEMKNLGFCDQVGRITPEARDVVLSALTGELENTNVVSPFTKWSDRKVAEFVNSVDGMKGDFRPELAVRLFRETIGKEWLRRIQDPPAAGRGGFSVN